MTEAIKTARLSDIKEFSRIWNEIRDKNINTKLEDGKMTCMKETKGENKIL